MHFTVYNASGEIQCTIFIKKTLSVETGIQHKYHRVNALETWYKSHAFFENFFFPFLRF